MDKKQDVVFKTYGDTITFIDMAGKVFKFKKEDIVTVSMYYQSGGEHYDSSQFHCFHIWTTEDDANDTPYISVNVQQSDQAKNLLSTLLSSLSSKDNVVVKLNYTVGVEENRGDDYEDELIV